MAKKNITLQIDEALLKRSKHLAVDEDMSLSEWVANLVAGAVRAKSGRESARQKALAILKSPLHLGGNVFSRESLHER
jgi:hypothetical protein